MSGITIFIPDKKIRRTKNSNPCKILKLEGYINIEVECLKYFYGCWLKFINKKTKEQNPGGFLMSIKDSTVYIRTVRSPEHYEVNLDEQLWFVKNDTPQYHSMQEFILDKQEIKHEKQKFKKEKEKLYNNKKIFLHEKNIFENNKIKFEKIKNNFYKLFLNGKVKILI